MAASICWTARGAPPGRRAVGTCTDGTLARLPLAPGRPGLEELLAGKGPAAKQIQAGPGRTAANPKGPQAEALAKARCVASHGKRAQKTATRIKLPCRLNRHYRAGPARPGRGRPTPGLIKVTLISLVVVVPQLWESGRFRASPTPATGSTTTATQGKPGPCKVSWTVIKRREAAGSLFCRSARSAEFDFRPWPVPRRLIRRSVGGRHVQGLPPRQNPSTPPGPQTRVRHTQLLTEVSSRAWAGLSPLRKGS